MNFLEAHKIVASFAGGEPLPFLLAMSGIPDKLGIFLRAAGARRARSVVPRTLPFNTLTQAILTDPRPTEREVFLLCPWDLVPETDWRSGFPPSPPDEAALRERAHTTVTRLARRPAARFLYIPASIPPLLPNPVANATLERCIGGFVQSLGADFLPDDAFSLSSYLGSGSPISGPRLGDIAEAIIGAAITSVSESCKVLVTDLDNVMWYGVIGEDGVDGIHYSPEGLGYRFFLYQSFLGKLKREGTLLAAVSRNDEELALAPFRSGQMTLGENDFVCILASYNAKSAQLAELAKQLNLGLDAFVFVDDNPVELAEVSAQLPAVHCVRSPTNEDGLPQLFSLLTTLFARTAVTSEDRERTLMYRRRLQRMVPVDLAGADVADFLRDLDMTLVIHDRTTTERTRVEQLINKTNQFNLNGRRFTSGEVGAILAAGGRLYGATLHDQHGTHGEVLACLISPKQVIETLVMSCRVFQRRVEYAFLSWLALQPAPPTALAFSPTARNGPIQHFLKDSAFVPNENGHVALNAMHFAHVHAEDLALFRLEEPGVKVDGQAEVRSLR